MHATSLSIVIAALFITVIGFAQSLSSHPQPHNYVASWQSDFAKRFEAADKDGDHMLTKEEAQAAQLTSIVDHFEEIDTDKDGKVSPKELREYLKHRLRTGPMA